MKNAADKAYKELYISKDKDPYMLMFLRDYCLCPSCYECKAKESKLSDITLADFWGINRICSKMSNGKGTSLVLVRTEKGAKVLQRIMESMKTQEVSYEEGVADNRVEYMSAPRPAPVPLKRKIKLGVKRILFRVGLTGGYRDNSS